MVSCYRKKGHQRSVPRALLSVAITRFQCASYTLINSKGQRKKVISHTHTCTHVGGKDSPKSAALTIL